MRRKTTRFSFRALILIFLFATISGSISGSSAYAQDSTVFSRENWAIFAKGGLLFNSYGANITNFEGLFGNCGTYIDGGGTGYYVNAGYEHPLSWLSHISIGIGISDRSGTIDADGNCLPARNPLDMGVDSILTARKIDATLSYLEIQPDFRYTVVPELINAPLRVFGGFRIAIPLSKTYIQDEEIESPSNVVFTDGDGNTMRDWTLSEGDLVNAGIGFGISLGLEHMLLAGDNLMITQELAYQYNFTNVISDEGADWGLSAVQLGIGIRYADLRKQPKMMIIPPEPPMPGFPVAPKADTVKLLEEYIASLPDPVLDLSIYAETNLNLFSGEELLASLPLVNAVFFDKSSKEIPEFYLKTNGELPEFFYGDAVDMHKYVMPRIAKILKENPEATITLEGATSSKYERGGTYLGTMRAREVEKVLIGLGVDKSRITVKGRYAPKFASNLAFKKAAIENQRVDLFVENAPLQKYVALQNFVELSGYYKTKLEWEHVNVDSGDVWLNTSLPDSTIKVMESGSEFRYAFDKLRIDPKAESLDIDASAKYWDIEDFANISIPYDSIPTEIVDMVLSKFLALIRFDYNSSELSEDNKGLLKQMSEFLPEGSTVVIYGSADAIGSAEHNTKLANDRAMNTIQYIQEVSGNKFNIEQSIDDTKYPEETPQGRFLNRSIKVRVRK